MSESETGPVDPVACRPPVEHYQDRKMYWSDDSPARYAKLKSRTG